MDKPDLIDRKNAIDMLHYFTDERCSSVVGDFERIPAVDAEPVLHSHWVKRTKFDEWRSCYECGFERHVDSNFGKAIYCPNCGAKMDAKEAPHDQA